MSMDKYVCIVMINAFFMFLFLSIYCFYIFICKLFKNKNINSYYIKMDMETLIAIDLNSYINSYSEALSSYDSIQDIYDETSENMLAVFTTSLGDKVIIDTDTLNTIMMLLEKIYANNLALLFLMSCLSSLYVCTYTRRKKDYIMINNVQPKLLKGEIVEKV